MEEILVSLVVTVIGGTVGSAVGGIIAYLVIKKILQVSGSNASRALWSD